MRPVKKRMFPMVRSFRSKRKRIPKPKKLAPRKHSIALRRASRAARPVTEVEPEH
jgi:hypothetical protein